MPRRKETEIKTPKQEKYMFYKELAQAMRDTKYPASYYDVPDAMFDIEERYQQLIRIKSIGIYISISNLRNWLDKNKDTLSDDAKEWYQTKMKELLEEKAKFEKLHPKLSDECYEDMVMFENIQRLQDKDDITELKSVEVEFDETGTDKKDN